MHNVMDRMSTPPAALSAERDRRDADLLGRALRVCEEVVRPNASDVDLVGRFPKEAFDALRSAGLLGAYVPRELGGGGASVAGVTAIGHELAKRCASTGMIYAMHQIQVACLAHHGMHQPAIRQVLETVAAEKALLASATTEAGIGGDLGSSTCSIERLDDGNWRLQKDAPVISYGDDADVIVATARRSANAPASDQVLAVSTLGPSSLEKRSTWDAFGMRGTCSNGYLLDVSGTPDLLLDTPYAELSAVSMIPMAHLTWAGVWSGIGFTAVDTARRYLRTQARKSPSVVPPIAADVATLYSRYVALRGSHQQALAQYQALLDEHPDHESRLALASKPAFSLRMLTLKPTTSEEVLKIVQGAMHVCGFAAYSNVSPFSLGRQLRDAHSAPLMVHNERIYGNGGALLCIWKES